MKNTFGFCSVLVAICSVIGSAHAGSKASSKDSPPAPAAESGTASETPVPSDVPRDPRGIKGISPVWEAIAAGDAAMVAKDPDTAAKHYEDALKADAKHPMAHYRMGEVRKAKGQLSEAQAAFEAAVRHATNDPDVKAKALFALAALNERQNNLAEAKSAWKRYEDHVAKHTEIKAFAASASERLKRLEVQEQLSRDYAAVKERIKKTTPAK